MQITPVVEFRGVGKRFAGIAANEDISFAVNKGAVHAVVGENGAGKTTLMNILYGLYQPEEGQVEVFGKPVSIPSPRAALDHGIGMIHQHFMLVDTLSVVENIVLGLPGQGMRLSLDAHAEKIDALSRHYGFDINLHAPVWTLPMGMRQRVEILKALANDARFLVFDEPTAVLTPQEIDDLMRVMQSLRDEGKGIVFITHKLREVRAIADRITVMRRGKIVGHAEPHSSEADLAELMVGRAVDLRVEKTPAHPGATRLAVRDLRVANPAGGIVVDGVSFEVAGGEILCVAGVQGNGQSELADAMLGNVAPLSGEIVMDGVTLTKASPRATIDAGMGFVPEDREVDGFVGNFTIAENLILNRATDAPFAKGVALNWGAILANAEERKVEFDIRAQSVSDPISSLSGGNKQKVILARELSRPLAVLVASQPTRGVDVGAIEFLHKRLVEERDQGTAVLLVSTELDEVEALADRVLVMYRGKVVGIVAPDTPREVLGLMMAGVPFEEATKVGQAGQAAPTKEEDHG